MSGVNFLTSAFNNGFPDEFSSQVTPYLHGGRFVFVASDFENHEKSLKYARIFLHFFEEKGIFFSGMTIVDHGITKTEAHAVIAGADLVWLSGGDTLLEMEYFREYEIAAALQKREGVTVGMSAGSINMAARVVLAKDESDNIPQLSVYEGLGLVDINIEPHVNSASPDHWEEIFQASMLAPVYCLHDDSFILEKDGELELFGQCELAEKGRLEHLG